MSSTSRLVRFGVLTLAMAALSACAAAIHVNSVTERGVDLSLYRTYEFAPPDSFSTGDPRLDNNPFFHGRVEAAVVKELGAMGYERPAAGTPDMIIHFHASMTQQVVGSEIDQNAEYCTNGDCRSFVYDAGTLVLEFVDTRTNTLIWRGWAEETMDGVVDDQALMETRIDDAVARILARLPNRS